jgi:ATP-dependent Clp protease protease subunit
LAQAGAAGKRFILPEARVMIHQPLGGFHGQVSDALIHVEEMNALKERLIQIYIKHNSAGKTHQELEAAMDRDNFMGATKALEFGLVDEIWSERKS